MSSQIMRTLPELEILRLQTFQRCCRVPRSGQIGLPAPNTQASSTAANSRRERASTEEGKPRAEPAGRDSLTGRVPTDWRSGFAESGIASSSGSASEATGDFRRLSWDSRSVHGQQAAWQDSQGSCARNVNPNIQLQGPVFGVTCQT